MAENAGRKRAAAKPPTREAQPPKAAASKRKSAKPNLHKADEADDPRESAKKDTKRSPKKPARASSVPVEGPWSLPIPPNAIPGFSYGLPYPAVRFHCRLAPTTPAVRAALVERFEALFEGANGVHPLEPFVDPASGDTFEDTAFWFGAIASRLQRLANLPVYASAKVIGRGPDTAAFVFPVLLRGRQATIELLRLLCKAFAEPDRKLVSALRDQAHVAFAGLKQSALTTSNTPRLVKAAVENGIAVQELAGSMVLYGIGRNSALMDSSFTFQCSNIGARLAKLKHFGAALLRRAGLPAPANATAQNEDHAVTIAHRLGFPVVVKPADKDGGVAVQADLRTDEEVREAYTEAHKVSRIVLVEKFHQGLDYRILVFRGKAIWAKERQPACVIGDGTSTITDLVEAVNTDPRRGGDAYAPLKRIVLDNDAASLLAGDGMDFNSVPEKNRVVRLRRRANISSGGTPWPVMDKMHPDNARLAERAAGAFGLGLAGVDLIIPDIAVSWRECDAAICEINAQPELGADGEGIYAQVLKNLVNGSGRIPTIAIFGGDKADALTRELAAALAAQGLRVGWHDRSGVHVGNETLVEGRVGTLRAGEMLTMDRKVEALVLGGLDVAVLREGLPVLQIDVLLFTGDLPTETRFAAAHSVPFLIDTMRATVPHCQSVVALDEPGRFDPALLRAIEQATKVDRTVPTEQRARFLGGLVRQSAAMAGR